MTNMFLPLHSSFQNLPLDTAFIVTLEIETISLRSRIFHPQLSFSSVTVLLEKRNRLPTSGKMWQTLAKPNYCSRSKYSSLQKIYAEEQAQVSEGNSQRGEPTQLGQPAHSWPMETAAT